MAVRTLEGEDVYKRQPLHPLEGPDEETNLITQWALLKTATGLQQIWIEHPSCGGTDVLNNFFHIIQLLFHICYQL